MHNLDGDALRHGLNRDLGFSDEDRVENIRRVGELARLFNNVGMIVLVADRSRPFARNATRRAASPSPDDSSKCTSTRRWRSPRAAT